MDPKFLLRNLMAGTNIKLSRPPTNKASVTLSSSSSSSSHNSTQNSTPFFRSSLPQNTTVVHSSSSSVTRKAPIHVSSSSNDGRKYSSDSSDENDDDEADEMDEDDSDTSKANEDDDDDTVSDDDEEEESSLALFKHSSRKGIPSTSSSAKSSSLSSSSSSSSSTDLVDQQYRKFRKQMGIKIQGNQVPNLYSTFTDIPEVLTLSQTQDISLLRSYTFTSSTPSLPNTTDHNHHHHHHHHLTERIQRYHEKVRQTILENIELSAYKEPTPIQMQSLPSILNNRDTLGYAPTGSGKTAAYLLPLLLRLQCHNYSIKGPRVLIIVPTKELASQIVREANRLSKGLGIKSTVLNKAVVTGTQGNRVSATMDVPELIHQKPKGNKKKNNKISYYNHNLSSTKSTKTNDNLGKRKHDEVDETFDDNDEEYSSHGDNDNENDDDILRWTDDEDVPIITSKAGTSSAPSKPTVPSSSSPSSNGHQVIPKLPYCDILVTTPLLFVSLLAHTQKQYASELNCAADDVSVILPSVFSVVFDEVDKLLETGFIEQVDKILEVTQSKPVHPPRTNPSLSSSSSSLSTDHPTNTAKNILPHRVQYCMFTATLPSGIEALISTVLTNPVKIFVGVRGSVITTVQQKLLFVGREDGKLLALRDMIKTGVKTPALIFTQSKDRANQVYHALQLDSLRVGVIHADCTDTERETRIQQFRRGQLLFLVTTDLLGRGLDFKGVNMVINFDLPQSGIAYIHRIGRTGRAGRQGEAVTFFTEEDILHLRTIANVMRISGCEVPEWMLSIKKLDRKERKRFEQRVPYRSTVGPRHSVTENDKKADRQRRKKQRKSKDGKGGQGRGNTVEKENSDEDE